MKQFLFLVLLLPAMEIGLAEKKPVKTEKGKVTDQRVVMKETGAKATSTGGSILTMTPVYKKYNYIKIETEEHRYAMSQQNETPLMLTIGESVEFYREKDKLVLLDSKGKKHKFAVIQVENIQVAQPEAPRVPVISDESGNEIVKPVAFASPNPEYTEEARQELIEGIIILQAIIGTDGIVDSAKVVKGLGYGLDESAINTVSAKWRFKPAMLNGMPVCVQIAITVSFRLNIPEADKAAMKEYPFRIRIVQAHWERNDLGWLNGSGYGNLKEGDILRGFTFTCSCLGRIRDRYYPAKWKKQELQLEVFGSDIGTTKQCELKVTMQDLVYALKNGILIALSRDQWNRMQLGGESK
jgi:TonB family protein